MVEIQLERTIAAPGRPLLRSSFLAILNACAKALES